MAVYAVAAHGVERVGHGRGGEGRWRFSCHRGCIPKEGGRPCRGITASQSDDLRCELFDSVRWPN